MLCLVLPKMASTDAETSPTTTTEMSKPTEHVYNKLFSAVPSHEGQPRDERGRWMPKETQGLFGI